MCSLEENNGKVCPTCSSLTFNFSSSVKGKCATKVEFWVLLKLPYPIIHSVTTGQFGAKLQGHLKYWVTMEGEKNHY